jgi:hypothetical protein
MRDRNFDDEGHLKSYLKDFFDSKSQKFGTDKIYNLHRRWVEVADTNGEYIVLGFSKNKISKNF